MEAVAGSGDLQRDGAAVQADLRAVMERSEDARAVLGLSADAGPAEARAAFHALCKRYHPTRFARSSSETVRLANEAFLAIRRAYDEVSRPVASGTGAVPVVSAVRDSGGQVRLGTDAPPIRRPTTGPTRRPTNGPIPRPTSGPIPRPTSGPIPSRTSRIPRRSSGPVAKGGAIPSHRRTSAPPASLRETQRVRSVPAAARATLKMTPIAPAPEAAPPDPPAPAAPDSEADRFTRARELLRRRLWGDAERALGDLAVTVPTNKTYRAYRDYARGRLAQDEGRLDEARAAWERALRLDPDLGAARAAIDSLPAEPRPSGGLWSRLFKR
jgi:hypothetical protein